MAFVLVFFPFWKLSPTFGGYFWCFRQYFYYKSLEARYQRWLGIRAEEEEETKAFRETIIIPMAILGRGMFTFSLPFVQKVYCRL